eukprot:6123846-Amphidinium_carterae.1
MRDGSYRDARHHITAVACWAAAEVICLCRGQQIAQDESTSLPTTILVHAQTCLVHKLAIFAAVYQEHTNGCEPKDWHGRAHMANPCLVSQLQYGVAISSSSLLFVSVSVGATAT